MKRPVRFSIHAERLHDDGVWRITERVASRMAQRNQQATFFVYPFRSIAAGCDVADRVRALGALGHEIGQHTHFYAGTITEGPHKRNDLAADHVRACIERDRDYLAALGHPPRGFTSGAFIVTPELTSILSQLGFAYDCSGCYPKPNRRVVEHGEVLDRPIAPPPLHRIPTYASVGEWFKWGWRGDATDPVVFVHDYDLVVARYRVLWSALLRTTLRSLPIGATIDR